MVRVTYWDSNRLLFSLLFFFFIVVSMEHTGSGCEEGIWAVGVLGRLL